MKREQSMAQTQLAVFKYKHGDRISLSGKRKVFFVVSLIIALALSKLLFPFGLVALIVPVLAYLGGGRTLAVGPRYFICGRQIIYYANVTKLKLSESEGVLKLQTANGNQFMIERERFPTNARKKDKVAANKAAKFNKVTARIIEKVRRAVPAVADA
jgi:hypothetical protein